MGDGGSGTEAEPPSRRRFWFPAPEVPAGPVTTRHWARYVLAISVAAYVAFYTGATFLAHDRFHTFGFDLGIYDQAMWLMSRFESPFATVMGRHLFGDHTSFILVPFVPLYWLWASPKVLLALQALALGAAAVPVFLIARDLLRDERLALFPAVAFLLQPALGWTNYEQFHPDVFEVPILLFALWFMLRRNWLGFGFAVGALLLVKEDVPLLTIALGVYVAVRYSRKVGLVSVAVSAAWFVVAVYVVLRHFNGVGTLNAWRIPFGGALGLIHTTFAEPDQVVRYLLGDGRPWYLWQLLAPLALLPLLAPHLLVIAIGPLASNALSTFWYQYQIQYHYGTLILPVLVVAAVAAVARFPTLTLRGAAAGLLLGASLVSAYAWGPLPFAREHPGLPPPSRPSAATIERGFALIPADASVSAHFRYVTHLTTRREIYQFPTPFSARSWGLGAHEGRRLPEADALEWVIVPSNVATGRDAPILAEVMREMEVVLDEDGILVLRRGE
jgi:uncharacterized membrane protein